MKRVYARGTLFLLAVFLCAGLKTNKVSASDEQIWFSGISASNASSNGSLYDGNTRCQYQDVVSQFLQNITLVGSIFTVTNSTQLTKGNSYTNQCMYSTEEGLFTTSNLWAPDGNKNAVMPIDNPNYTVRSLDNKRFIIREGSPSAGISVSYNDKQFQTSGTVSVKTYGSGISKKYERSWKIDTSKLSEFYTYSDGSLVRFHEFATSRNGEYAVGAIASRGLVRIHLPSGELTAISNSTFNNGVGLFMTISNDGRYVATTKAGSGKLMMYDLLDCSQKYARGQWARFDVLNGSGCTSKDLYTELRTQYPKITNASGVYFGSSIGELELFIFQPNTQGQQVSQFVRLYALGYVSSVQGYLAMGDSFASGEGDLGGETWYESGTDEQGSKETFDQRNLCHLSRRSYPYLLAVQTGFLLTNAVSPSDDSVFHSIACSGAKAHNIVGSGFGEKQSAGSAKDFEMTDNQYRFDRSLGFREWQPGYMKQNAYLNERILDDVEKSSINPEIITISIGGNDAGFGKKLLACAGFGTCEIAEDPQRRAEVAVEIGLLKPKLEGVYKSVRANAPEAKIYVVGYPQFIQKEGGFCHLNTPFDDEERLFITEAVAYMNDVIENATIGAGVTYVDVENIFAGTELCSQPNDGIYSVNGVTLGNDIDIAGFCSWRDGCIGAESFHPNHYGHIKFAERIAQITNDFSLNNNEPSQSLIPKPQDYFGVFAMDELEKYNNNQIISPNPKTTDLIVDMVSPSSPKLELEGLFPGSTVRFEVHSDPIILGEATVDAGGVAQFSGQLPNSLPEGYHELFAYGFDALGNSVVYYEPILIGVDGEDFDGDGVINEVDSCPVVVNSGSDVDEDGIDDACDLEVIALVQEDEIPPEEPVVEVDPAEYVEDKGSPSPETVAGDEQMREQGEVLGLSISSVVAGATVLAATGLGIGLVMFVGFGTVFFVAFMHQQKR